jgi:hypothetical protein
VSRFEVTWREPSRATGAAHDVVCETVVEADRVEVRPDGWLVFRDGPVPADVREAWSSRAVIRVRRIAAEP